jgi:bacterioferritin (cytochrome b1)
MADPLSERLKACIAVESNVAEIYHTFRKMFPEARDFWHQLAMEEENHAAILAVGEGFHRVGKLPDYFVPDSLPLINQSLTFIKEVQRRIEEEDISLKEALELSLQLERTMEESYLYEIITKETDSKMISKLQKLAVDTGSHIKQIEDYKAGKGL